MKRQEFNTRGRNIEMGIIMQDWNNLKSAHVDTEIRGFTWDT